MLSRLKSYRISIPYEGLLFLGGQSVVILVAMAYANNLAFLFAFLMTGLILVSIVNCLQRMNHIRLVQIHPLENYANHTGEIEIYYHNGDVEPILGVDAMIETDEGWERPKWKWGPKPKARSVEVRSKSNGITKAMVLPKSRGMYDIRRVFLSSTYPFGIVRVGRIFEVDSSFYVYPDPGGVKEWPEEGGVQAGEGDTGFGQGEDFTGHRKYGENDSQRMIDWKVYARTNELYLKEFSGGSEEAVLFDWRDIPSDNEETVASQLGTWIQEARNRRIRFGVDLPNARIEVSEGSRHFQRCMQHLATLRLPR